MKKLLILSILSSAMLNAVITVDNKTSQQCKVFTFPIYLDENGKVATIAVVGSTQNVASQKSQIFAAAAKRHPSLTLNSYSVAITCGTMKFHDYFHPNATLTLQEQGGKLNVVES